LSANVHSNTNISLCVAVRYISRPIVNRFHTIASTTMCILVVSSLGVISLGYKNQKQYCFLINLHDAISMSLTWSSESE